MRVDGYHISVLSRKQYVGTTFLICWLLKSFSLYVHHVTWAYGTWFGSQILNLDWTLHSNSFSKFCSVVLLCKSFIYYKNKFYLTRRRAAFIHEKKHMYLEDIWVKNSSLVFDHESFPLFSSQSLMPSIFKCCIEYNILIEK